MKHISIITIIGALLALAAVPAMASARGWHYSKMNHGQRVGFVRDMKRPQKINGGHVWFGPCSRTKGAIARNGKREFAAFRVSCGPQGYLIFAKKRLPGHWKAIAVGDGGFGYFGIPAPVEKNLMYTLTGHRGLA